MSAHTRFEREIRLYYIKKKKTIRCANVLSAFHCPCKSSVAQPKRMYTKWPKTSVASVQKFHMASDLGDGLNFDITTPEIIMPRPELKMPMAPDARLESAAVRLNWVSMYLGMNVQYPINPMAKNELLAELNISILFVKTRFIDVLKSGSEKLNLFDYI